MSSSPQSSAPAIHVAVDLIVLTLRDGALSVLLIQRDDDKEETVRERLDVYSRQTEPLTRYYQQWQVEDPARAPRYRTIDGVGTVEEIKARALALIGFEDEDD